MPEQKVLPVLWTDRSVQNTLSIKKYIAHKFSQKEVDNFYALLFAFEKAVSIFPKLYPLSNRQREVRRAVLSKKLSTFYRIGDRQIEVLAVLDNRCDISEWY